MKHSFVTLAVAASLLTASHDVAWAATDCEALPSPTPITGRTILVSTTGAQPGHGAALAASNTVFLQRALDSMQAGDALVFDVPGIYEHDKSLTVSRPGAILDGQGATLRGTNYNDQALLIQTDNVEVRNFVINNLTDHRGTTPKHAGIGTPSGFAQPFRNIRIIGNHLQGDGSVGGEAQNAGGGIFLYNVDGFVVASNTVERSVADGIHMTHGTRNGRVLKNVLNENGDDGIAAVSYIDTGWNAKVDAMAKAGEATKIAQWVAEQDATVVRNVLISGNVVKNGYWGRGISVVGGRDITVAWNTVTRIVTNAGIYISREVNTRGVNNVRVTNNMVFDIGTHPPTFVPAGPLFDYLKTSIAQANTGNGGIEVNGYGYSPEANALPSVRDVVSVGNVQLQQNGVSNTRWFGIRLGMYSGYMGLLGVEANLVNQQRGSGEYQLNASGFQVLPYCAGNNKAWFTPWQDPQCTATARPVVTGFVCTSGQP